MESYKVLVFCTQDGENPSRFGVAQASLALLLVGAI